jgi:hypothetical protein
MLTKRVIRVTLTHVTEAHGTGITSYVGTPLWRVVWTEEGRNGKPDRMFHTHCSEVAARRHVEGLLAQVDPALGNVSTESI